VPRLKKKDRHPLWSHKGGGSPLGHMMGAGELHVQVFCPFAGRGVMQKRCRVASAFRHALRRIIPASELLSVGPVLMTQRRTSPKPTKVKMN